MCLKKNNLFQTKMILQSKLYCLAFFLSYTYLSHVGLRSRLFLCFLLLFCHIVMYIVYYKYFVDLKQQIHEEKKNLFHLCIKPSNITRENFVTNSSCLICLDDCNYDSVCEVNCKCVGQFYHTDCLQKWIYQNPSCPICRQKVYQ